MLHYAVVFFVIALVAVALFEHSTISAPAFAVGAGVIEKVT